MASSLTQFVENLGTRLFGLNGKVFWSTNVKKSKKKKSQWARVGRIHGGYSFGQKNDIGKVILSFAIPLWPCNR